MFFFIGLKAVVPERSLFMNLHGLQFTLLSGREGSYEKTEPEKIEVAH